MGASVSIDSHTVHDHADVALIMEVYNILNGEYRDHPWVVGANHEGGVVDIQLGYMDNLGRISRMGYGLHIKNLDAGQMRKRILRAGGELLERCRLARGQATEHSALDYAANGLDKSGAR